jgi:hypothetical protein
LDDDEAVAAAEDAADAFPAVAAVAAPLVFDELFAFAAA